MGGYLTYDEIREAPYTLTKFFYENDFSARDGVFFSSNSTKNKELGLSLLSALYKLKKHCVEIKHSHYVEMNRYWNLLGVIVMLDLMNKDEVEEKVLGVMRISKDLSKI